MAPKWAAMLHERHWEDRVNRLFRKVYGDVRIDRPIEQCVVQMVNDFLGRGLLASWYATPVTYLEILEGLEAELELDEGVRQERLDQRIATVHWHVNAGDSGPLPPTVDHPYAVCLHQTASLFGIWNPITSRFTDASRVSHDETAMELLKGLEDRYNIVPPKRPIHCISDVCDSSDSSREELRASTFGRRLYTLFGRLYNQHEGHVDTNEMLMQKLGQLLDSQYHRNAT